MCRLVDFFACAALWLFAYGVGLSLSCLSARRFLDCVPTALAFPCIVIGLLVLPLCGAAPTFLCRRKEKIGKRKRLEAPAKRVPRTVAVVVHLESVPSHLQPE